MMPKQGQSVESCILSKWLINKGEAVKKGDLLFSYETDKAAFEEEAPADGFLLDVFYEEGSEVPVLVNVAVIGQIGENSEAYRPGGAQPAIIAKEAVAIAAEVATAGDIVLLSPGGTSFDEFKDFAERGETFRKWVLELS